MHGLPDSYLRRLRNDRIEGTSSVKQHRGHQMQPRENIKRGIPKAKLREYLLSIE